jgi:hypothetical protein
VKTVKVNAKLYYSLMLLTMGVVPNPGASASTLRRRAILAIVEITGTTDPEIVDNPLNAILVSMRAHGAERVDLQAFVKAYLSMPVGATEMATMNEVANLAGKEGFWDNLGDVGERLANFDLIGAGRESVDTVLDLGGEIFDLLIPG